ncbi:hypothetical protein GCM10022223_27320 [Kineosporia mesophila]|uniref:Uncharacterized protein n=1 Tax=Kineosporia mesophila TaxID=566012 RepID=A0ABP6ZHG6_9ACTN
MSAGRGRRLAGTDPHARGAPEALATQRLVQLGIIGTQDGLFGADFADIEQQFDFESAADHRASLTAGLPIWTAGHDDHPDKPGWGWPSTDHNSGCALFSRHLAAGHSQSLT